MSSNTPWTPSNSFKYCWMSIEAALSASRSSCFARISIARPPGPMVGCLNTSEIGSASSPMSSRHASINSSMSVLRLSAPSKSRRTVAMWGPDSFASALALNWLVMCRTNGLPSSTFSVHSLSSFWAEATILSTTASVWEREEPGGRIMRASAMSPSNSGKGWNLSKPPTNVAAEIRSKVITPPIKA